MRSGTSLMGRLRISSAVAGRESAPLRRLHQLQSGRQSQAALSGQRNGFELRARLVAGAGKSDANLVAAEHGIFALRRRVLLIEDLAEPAAF